MIAQYILLLLFFYHQSLFSRLPFNLFDVSLSGYFKGETYTDSRQTISDLDDEIAYFPTEQIDDPAGHDINARSSTRMDAFESRLCADFSGLSMGKANIAGKIEIDFEIFDTEITNCPHLRQAYGTIDTEHFTLLFGQTHHPVLFMEPKNINYNGSSPFNFYARSPQFSLRYKPSKLFNVLFIMTSETTDYDSDGPYGFSTNYIRWGIIPNLHLKFQWCLGNHVMTLGGDYKKLAPRIESYTGYKVTESITSFAAIWFLKLTWPSIEIISQIDWGQNPVDYGASGGFAVIQNSINPVTNQQKYTNISVITLMYDIEINRNKKLQPGLFLGFLQNLGSIKPIEFDSINPITNVITRNIFGFLTNVNNVFRIAPRISAKINTITFSGEIEYTRATYGTITRYAHVTNTKPAELVRCTLGVYYFF